MWFFLHCAFLLSLPIVFGGSPCPPRSNIRPCICLERPLGKKKLETTLICHNLADDTSIEAINTALYDMEIDKFLLYDSFGQMAQNRVPMNIFTTYRMKEIDVVDTTMKNFGCPRKDNCATTFLKRLSSTNSTLYEKQSCNEELTVFSWISCTQKLEYLKISNGIPQDFQMKPEFFPQPMTKLLEFHLTDNRISRIDKRTFLSSKFPALQTLNLSRNHIRDARIFMSPMKIKHLDLSHNPLRNIVEFSNLPHLQTLRLINSQITVLLESEWTHIPTSLLHLDVSSNTLKCDCSGFKWVNSTFHINTNLLGSCDTPSEVKGMKLRKASRTLIERCDEKNVIGSRPRIRRV